MPDKEFQRLLEIAWRRPLSREELARLRAMQESDSPELVELGLEQKLTVALNQLPDVPVASNFTARVLQQIELWDKATARKGQPHSWFRFRRWMPRVALAGGLAIAGLVLYQEEQARAERAAYARSLATISQVPAPGPGILQDFEAIRSLSRTPPPDEELLSILK
jgi:hypothetical protein